MSVETYIYKQQGREHHVCAVCSQPAAVEVRYGAEVSHSCASPLHTAIVGEALQLPAGNAPVEVDASALPTYTQAVTPAPTFIQVPAHNPPADDGPQSVKKRRTRRHPVGLDADEVGEVPTAYDRPAITLRRVRNQWLAMAAYHDENGSKSKARQCRWAAAHYGKAIALLETTDNLHEQGD